MYFRCSTLQLISYDNVNRCATCYVKQQEHWTVLPPNQSDLTASNIN